MQRSCRMRNVQTLDDYDDLNRFEALPCCGKTCKEAVFPTLCEEHALAGGCYKLWSRPNDYPLDLRQVIDRMIDAPNSEADVADVMKDLITKAGSRRGLDAEFFSVLFSPLGLCTIAEDYYIMLMPLLTSIDIARELNIGYTGISIEMMTGQKSLRYMFLKSLLTTCIGEIQNCFSKPNDREYRHFLYHTLRLRIDSVLRIPFIPPFPPMKEWIAEWAMLMNLEEGKHILFMDEFDRFWPIILGQVLQLAQEMEKRPAVRRETLEPLIQQLFSVMIKGAASTIEPIVSMDEDLHEPQYSDPPQFDKSAMDIPDDDLKRLTPLTSESTDSFKMGMAVQSRAYRMKKNPKRK